ncbi:MAG TPA: carboxypeptidase-like regulatory domain-containing protein [Gemmataceae bacterium]|nr:carboxypeptidase-like regulatory domain-containing protein [Gemmataceae bacterium]
MRPLLVLLCATFSLAAADPFERQLSDALRDAHDRGADLYNAGDMAACYRLFQGSLIVAKGMLGEYPKLQRLVADGLAEADRETQVGKRAFVLHELIEKVRSELRVARRGPEALTVPPREVKSDAKPKPGPAAPPASKKPTTETKPAAVVEAKSGVVGRVLWQGNPLAGAEVMFVSLGQQPPRVYEAMSGAQGTYAAPDVAGGKYVVTIVPGPKCEVKKLPDRYATTTTSPLVFDVKAGGEKLDFLLQ